MAIPGDLTTITVTDTYVNADGTPAGGTVTFTPTSQLQDATGAVVVTAASITAAVNAATGIFSIVLPCTDNADLTPSTWAYTCVINVPGVNDAPFTALFPSALGSSVELRTIAPSLAPPPRMWSAVYSVNGRNGAVVLAASDVNALPLAGGTLTGPLVLAADPTATLQAATKHYVDSHGGGGGAALDTTDNPAALGSAFPGVSSQGSPADHVHPVTGLVTSASLPLAIASGGTGSGTQNFADLTSSQSIAGIKTFSGEVVVPAPVNSGDAVTKAYADAIALGLPGKYSARAATVGTESYTYTIVSGSVTQVSGTVVDTVPLSIGDFLLIKDAPAATGTGTAFSSEPANGHYQVTGNTTNLSVSRAADMSGSNGPAGAYVFVVAGTANEGDGFVVTTPSSAGAFTYGSGNIQFTQFTSSGTITAGSGLTQTGTVISLTAPVAAASLPAATTTTQGAVILDNTSTDIKQLAASRSAGTSTQAAKADHIHPTTGLVSTSTTASGDLSGTYPGPAVAKIQGTAISAPPGGTTAFLAGNGTWQTPAGSNPMTALGDTIYGGASGAGTRLAGNITAAKQFHTQTGTGTISAAPAWGTISAGDVPTLNQNTTGTAAGLSSTLAVSSGGTGDVTLTPYAPLTGGFSSTGALQQCTTGLSTSGYVLTSNGSSALPTFQASSGGGASASVLTASYGTATQSLNASTYGAFLLTLTGNPTFTFTGATAGTECSFTAYLKQDATGSRTVTWPGSVKWQDGIPPALTTTATKTDILVFTSPDGGTTWYGSLAGANY